MPGLIWCHSGYSFLRGTASVEDMVSHAAALGWKSMAITDLNGFYGSVWFWEFAKDAGLNPLLGAELRDDKGEAAVLLVKSAEGYKRLCRMISQRHLDKNFSLKSALSGSSSGLAVLTESETLAGALAGAQEIDLYILLPPHKIHGLARFASMKKLRPVAANPVYYLKREDRYLHHMLRAIDLNQSLSMVKAFELCPDPAWMPTPDEFNAWYGSFPEALKNLEELVEKCSMDSPPWGQLVLFDFEGMSRDECLQTLCRKTRAGAVKRYGTITEAVKARIEKELGLVRQKGFASYFLIIEDIIRRFPVNCGRGSAAASIISYCLEITHVDPVRHNLFFERFLSPGRKDPPDIDVDFPWDERDRVLDYVFSRYGPERSAMVSNHLTFQGRSAMRQAARVFGLSDPEISRVTKRLHGYWETLEPVSAMEKKPLFRGVHFDPPWDRVVEVALRLQGLPCGMSVHCGGVVIADKLQERVPLEQAPKGVNIIQWEKDQTEDSGLIKLDLLGNRSLAVIRDSINALNKNQGAGLDYAALDPLDDPDTQRLIASGKTMGVFYIESPATCQLQRKAQVGDFEHIVIHSSIIRPAAHKFINEYVKRLRGQAWDSIDPRLNRVLSETYGIMVYQEDVMKVAVELAGFSIEDADELRRALSKKHKQKKVLAFKEKFAKGAGQNGLDQEQVDKIWEMVDSFKGYSFCKPHSASYAMVSFKSAWLKAHHQSEFLAAVISNQGGYYSAFAYLSEARRLGIRIRPPDINQSRVEYFAETDEAASCDPLINLSTYHLINSKSLRVGFMQIKGLEQKFAEKIVAEREKNGLYKNLPELLHRLNPDPEQARLLVKAGTLDALEGIDRRTALLWIINSWEKARPKSQKGFFPIDCKAPKALKKLSETELLRQEQDAFGFLVSRHPLSLYRDRIKDLRLTPASEFKNKIGQRVAALGWRVTGKLAETGKGEVMEFVSFEDETDMFETVFFPDAYRRYCHLLNCDAPFLLFGKISQDLSAISLEIDRIQPLGKTVTGRHPSRFQDHNCVLFHIN